jgi:hypothetical protein
LNELLEFNKDLNVKFVLSIFASNITSNFCQFINRRLNLSPKYNSLIGSNTISIFSIFCSEKSIVTNQVVFLVWISYHIVLILSQSVMYRFQDFANFLIKEL